jgi:uncharacterized protein (DUF433 family)
MGKIKDLVLAGKTDEQVVEEVKADYPKMTIKQLLTITKFTRYGLSKQKTKEVK